MSNSTPVSASKKPCYRFWFADSAAAEKFFAYASKQPVATKVQYPYAPNKRAVLDLTKVYVIGTGDAAFDANLRSALIGMANDLGGHCESEL